LTISLQAAVHPETLLLHVVAQLHHLLGVYIPEFETRPTFNKLQKFYVLDFSFSAADKYKNGLLEKRYEDFHTTESKKRSN
jgi:hypothetical protein